MPTILVMSNANTEQSPAVTLEETVEPEHLASDQHAAELIERVGWALTEAKDVEETDDDPAPEPREEVASPNPRQVEKEVYEKLYGRRPGDRPR
jgi:hypothetical protein